MNIVSTDSTPLQSQYLKPRKYGRVLVSVVDLSKTKKEEDDIREMGTQINFDELEVTKLNSRASRRISVDHSEVDSHGKNQVISDVVSCAQYTEENKKVII